jgi:hypothetical protein
MDSGFAKQKAQKQISDAVKFYDHFLENVYFACGTAFDPNKKKSGA